MSRSEWFDGAVPGDGPGGGQSAGGGPGGGRGAGGGGSGGGTGSTARAGANRRGRSPLLVTLGVLITLLVLGTIAAEVITDLWWFDSVGYRRVFLTEIGTRAGLFLLAFLLTAGAVGASLVAAYRTRPLYVPVTPAQQAVDQYRQALDPLRKVGTIAVPAILGLLAGSGAMGAWQTYLLWRNRVPFGRTDAQFTMDIGFFVFTLPWLRFLVSFLTVVLVLALIAGAFIHYVYGGLQLPGRGPTTRAAFIHLSVIGALLALVRAADYWLDRYALTTSESRLLTGITYTDANAVMPAKAILAVAAVMCAGFFLASIWTRSWRVPLIGVSLLVILAVVVGGIYPALIQSLRVRPSQKSLEAPFIQRNIEATRSAFALEGIDRSAYSARTDTGAGQLRADAATIPGIRIIDPNVVTPTFRQFQGLRQFYAFPDTLDVDRYTINGQRSDAVVAVRELNLDGVPDGQRNWLNDHTVFTHGFGFIAAYGNRRTSEGDPEFFSGGFADRGAMGRYQPRVYFGEVSPTYSIVGAPRGSEPREFDFPDDASPNGTKNNTYSGRGGVPIGNFFQKAAYAVKYREANFLLSNQVNSASRILDHREPKERVSRVAPWLTLDGNVYPAVVDGRIQWVVDGYTTTARYPSSRLTDLADATSDSVSERSDVVTIGAGRVNYMRNSVKATVDAYDGTVRLYAWDTEDPLLRAWGKAFPRSLRPVSEMSGALMSHVRYPQDMLKVQRQLFSRYHVTDANSFFGGSDFWRVPKDPTHATQDQPPYYQSLAMPGQSSPAFSLTTTFIPQGTGREILRGFLAVDGDAGNTAGKVSDQYGTMRLLELPRDVAVDGPGQVQNKIEVSTARSQSPTEPLNLSQFIGQNRQSGRQLTFGNLLTLPVGDGLLYVQPMYVQASREGGSFPQNKATVAVFGNTVAWGETLDQALDGVFGGNSGARAGDAGAAPAAPGRGSGGTGGGDGPGAGGGGAGGSTTAQLADLIRQIEQANADGQAALKAGDFAKYGEAQRRLQAAVEEAAELAPQLNARPGGAASPSPPPSPSPSPSPSP